jgi:hypothetical protein
LQLLSIAGRYCRPPLPLPSASATTSDSGGTYDGDVAETGAGGVDDGRGTTAVGAALTRVQEKVDGATQRLFAGERTVDTSTALFHGSSEGASGGGGDGGGGGGSSGDSDDSGSCIKTRIRAISLALWHGPGKHPDLSCMLDELTASLASVRANRTALYLRSISPLYFSAVYLRSMYPLYISALYLLSISPLYISALYLRSISPLYFSTLYLRSISPLYISSIYSLYLSALYLRSMSLLYISALFLRSISPLYISSIYSLYLSALYLVLHLIGGVALN